MNATRRITDDIIWVGCNDKRLELFENLFPLPKGVSYNSYIINDEKVALLDTVDSGVVEQFIGNIDSELGEKAIDYLVIHHMEPDHAGCIELLLNKYKDMKLVGNTKTKKMINQFFEIDIEDRMMIVGEGDELSLGAHTLKFMMAPMVHWPEVMVSYDEKSKILFSADAFGTFGTIDGVLFNDEVDFEKEFLHEARRYYANIVGKYGMQVQTLLKKVCSLDISMICPLHGPIWRNNLEYFIDKYDKWSKYEPEEDGVLILCGTVYNHTMQAANKLAVTLADKGISNIKIYDVSKTHVNELISEIFKYSHIAIACATYNNGIFPKMADLLHDMKALNVQNRKVAIIQNGTWVPVSGKLIKAELECMKNMMILDDEITIESALKKSQFPEIEKLAETIVQSF
ncbi:MAG: FprA family A-type flavoprotein [Suipraeoptans sp.]